MSFIRDKRFFQLLGAAVFLTLLVAAGTYRANSTENSTAYFPAVFVAEPCTDTWSDDFSSESSNWKTSNDDVALVEYRDGQFRIVAITPNRLIRPVAPVPGLQDYSVEAEMRWANGIYDGVYGLLFGGVVDQTNNDFLSEYYVFIIYAEREEYRLQYREKVGENADGSPILAVTDVVPRTKGDPISNDLYQWNTLKVAFVGDTIDAYINGVQVIDGAQQIGTTQPTITGLVSVANPDSPGNDARFDNYFLDGCNPTARAPQTQPEILAPDTFNLSIGDAVDSADLWD